MSYNTERRQSGLLLRANPKGGRPTKDGHYPIDWIKESETMTYRLGYCQCGRKVCVNTYDMEQVVNAFAYMLAENTVKPTLKQRIAQWLYEKADALSGKEKMSQEDILVDRIHTESMIRQFSGRDS